MSGAGDVALTGADCFLRAFDHEIRRKCRASHASQLVLRLGPGFDVDALRRLVTEAARANPILHSPIRRRGSCHPSRCTRTAGHQVPFPSSSSSA
jgi:hypothetical protein